MLPAYTHCDNCVNRLQSTSSYVWHVVDWRGSVVSTNSSFLSKNRTMYCVVCFIINRRDTVPIIYPEKYVTVMCALVNLYFTNFIRKLWKIGRNYILWSVVHLLYLQIITVNSFK